MRPPRRRCCRERAEPGRAVRRARERPLAERAPARAGGRRRCAAGCPGWPRTPPPGPRWSGRRWTARCDSMSRAGAGAGPATRTSSAAAAAAARRRPTRLRGARCARSTTASAAARVLRGEVLARWQEFVGTGELLRGAAGPGRPAAGPGDRGVHRPAAAGRGGRGGGREQRGVAGAGRGRPGGRADRRGLAGPAGRARRCSARPRTALGRSSEDFAERCGTEVRAWQGDVLELVRRAGRRAPDGGPAGVVRRERRRAAVMLAVFAQTGGLTGAEVLVAGGTSARRPEGAGGGLRRRRGPGAGRPRPAHDLMERVERLLGAEAERFRRWCAPVRPTARAAALRRRRQDSSGAPGVGAGQPARGPAAGAAGPARAAAERAPGGAVRSASAALADRLAALDEVVELGRGRLDAAAGRAGRAGRRQGRDAAAARGRAHRRRAGRGAPAAASPRWSTRWPGRRVSRSACAGRRPARATAVGLGRRPAPARCWTGCRCRAGTRPRAAPDAARSTGWCCSTCPTSTRVRLEHRLEADRLVELVDLLVWVLDPQKYADAALHDRYLRPARRARRRDAGRAQPGRPARRGRGRAACLADLRRLLAATGWPDVPVLAVSALTGEGLRPRCAGAGSPGRRRAGRGRSGWRPTSAAPRRRCGRSARTRAGGRRPAGRGDALVDALTDAAGAGTVADAVDRRAPAARGPRHRLAVHPLAAPAAAGPDAPAAAAGEPSERSAPGCPGRRRCSGPGWTRRCAS